MSRCKPALYAARVQYTHEQLDAYALDDLRIDAEGSEEIVLDGRDYDGGHARYAAQCRAQMAKYANGGAHAAILRGAQ